MKRRIPFIVAAILATLFIFNNSLQDGAQSTSDSDVIVDFITETSQQMGQEPDRFDVTRAVRKTAHVLEFTLQGILIAGCFSLTLRRRIIYVLILGFLTACVDEGIQLFSDGRAAMIQDVFIDFLGTGAGALIFALSYEFKENK